MRLALALLAAVLAVLAVGDAKTILFLSAWQKSPIISLQGLAEELASRGHTVYFSVTEQDKHLITSVAAGVKFLSAGQPPFPDTEFYAHELPQLLEGEARYAVSMFDHLLPILKNMSIDLIAYDPLQLAGEGLAHALNIPVVQVCPHLLSLCLLGGEESSAHPSVIAHMIPSNTLQRVKNAVLSKATRYAIPILRGFLQNSARKHMGMPAIWSRAAEPWGTSKLIIAPAFFGIDFPRSLPPLIQSVSTFLPRTPRPLAADVKSWLDADTKSPLVFISIGTNSLWNAETAQSMQKAIIQSAVTEKKFRVLWVVREKSDHSFFDFAALNKAQETGQLKVVSFVEQLSVLEHPSTRVFVSHAGLASLSESVYYGVPVVAMPMMLGSDQPTNAARVVQQGLGVWIDLRQGVPAPEAFSNAILEVLNTDSYRTQAQRFSALVRKLPGRAAAGDLLEAAMSPLNYVELLQPLDQTHFDVWVVFILIGILNYVLLGACLRCLCGRGPKTSKAKTA